MFDIKEELKKLPEKPGVYIMHNEADEIIYVGKAVILKNRVRQYFQNSKKHSPKIEKMVSQVAYFEYIITDSEVEALVLECNLIKEHSPKYNTMLKDDKAYPYIKVTLEEQYPRIMLARKIKRDKSKYFGPYVSGLAVKDAIELMQKLYHIRTCQRNLPRDIGKERPCLYYHIGQCKAPCQGLISREDYKKEVDKMLSFLHGNHKEVEKMLTQKMTEASQKMEFEQAMQYRDLLKSMKQLEEKQKLNQSDKEEQDIIAIAMTKKEAVIAVFFIRDGKLLGRDHFHMTRVEENNEAGVMLSFVKQFYAGTPYIPKEILLEYDIEEFEEKKLLEEWLSAKKQQKVYITTPKRGNKVKLIALAKNNAQEVLKKDAEKLKREEEKTKGAVKELGDLLGIAGIKRMEAFDISNTSGTQNVASMVVFEDGKPKKRDYRKFKIQTVNGPDDYKSMEEVLTRRFLSGKKEREEMERKKSEFDFGSFTKFPDLVLMDGGKGQVNIALSVLKSLGLNIPVCGMVKDDHHKTRGIYFHNREIEISASSEAFHLVTRMQDEAHRFAIEYHRSLRSKTQIKSVLDDIKGVGPARKKALMKYFKDIQKIREASAEELMKVDGITPNLAQEIYLFFRKK